jgi:nitroreductase
MNEKAAILKDIIEHRRSVKPEEFNGKIVPADIIDEILSAANWAPTHGLTEPWRFIVFNGKNGAAQFGKLHAEIYRNETSAEQFLQKKFDTLLHKTDHASHVIVVVMKRGDKDNIPEKEEAAATACAIQNMLLTAQANALASFWSTGGMCYHPSMRKHFGYGEEDKVMGVIYLGYSDKVNEGSRNSSVNEKTTWINS